MTEYNFFLMYHKVQHALFRYFYHFFYSSPHGDVMWHEVGFNVAHSSITQRIIELQLRKKRVIPLGALYQINKKT